VGISACKLLKAEICFGGETYSIEINLLSVLL